jgi:hypothetical protein
MLGPERGVSLADDLAEIYVRVGEYEAAIDQLEYLFSRPFIHIDSAAARRSALRSAARPPALRGLIDPLTVRLPPRKAKARSGGLLCAFRPKRGLSIPLIAIH